MIDHDLFSAAAVSVESIGSGRYSARVSRTDGEVFSIVCLSADAVADLLREMCPREYFIAIPTGSAERDAVMAALGDDRKSAPARTLH